MDDLRRYGWRELAECGPRRFISLLKLGWKTPRILRVRKWSALRAWGLRPPNGRACCALASILHRMWLNEADFHVAAAAIEARAVTAVELARR
jgi:hypothetical protein